MTYLAAASGMTIPIYLGLANSPLDDWFKSGAGWQAFEPLLRVCRALGIYSQGSVLITAMFAVSFIVALMILWGGTHLLRWLRR